MRVHLTQTQREMVPRPSDVPQTSHLPARGGLCAKEQPEHVHAPSSSRSDVSGAPLLIAALDAFTSDSDLLRRAAKWRRGDPSTSARKPRLNAFRGRSSGKVAAAGIRGRPQEGHFAAEASLFCSQRLQVQGASKSVTSSAEWALAMADIRAPPSALRRNRRLRARRISGCWRRRGASSRLGTRAEGLSGGVA